MCWGSVSIATVRLAFFAIRAQGSVGLGHHPFGRHAATRATVQKIWCAIARWVEFRCASLAATKPSLFTSFCCLPLMKYTTAWLLITAGDPHQPTLQAFSMVTP